MKRLFSCIRKPREKSSWDKLDRKTRSLNVTRDALSKSPFNNIPNEIILHIFRFLSIRDLGHVSLVCRSFKIIADHDDLWKSKFKTTIKLHSKSYKQMYIQWIQKRSLHITKVIELQRYYKRRPPSITYPSIIYPPPSYPRRPANKHQVESIGGFAQHPNSTQDLTITLSVDIDQTARQLISLLEKASSFQEQCQQSAVLKQMIQRYSRFMQLKASHPSDILLIPTLDIEIVWQTHLLRPEMYRNDCLRLFGRIIDHSLIMKNEMEQYFKEQAFIDTCQLYEQRFGKKYGSSVSTEENKTTSNYQSIYSYWDKTHFEFSSNPPTDYENPFSFTEGDLILDLKWFDLCQEFMSNAIDKISIQGCYFYKSSRIDLRLGALKRLKKSYERSLYMAAKYSLKDGNGFIPPTYAIDIIWHSHMQEPLNYEADCLRLVGYIIYHDRWPATEDEKMKDSSDQVDQIWKNEFECVIEVDHLYNTSNNPSL